MERYQVYKKILPNLMHVLLIPNINTNIVSIGIFVKVGSRYENKNSNGIAHFLEHMMFKGTKNRSMSEISKSLDGVGAEYNAATAEELTYYYIIGHNSDLDLFIDIIIDIYFNPVFKEDLMEMEKKVVIEELNMLKDEPRDIILTMLHETMFSNSGLKYPEIGTIENINNFTKNDLMNFREKFYMPERTVIVVSGNFDYRKVYKLIEKKAGIFKNKKIDTIYLSVMDPKIQMRPFIYIKKNSEVSQTNIMVTFRSRNMYSQYIEAYNLIGDLLTSGFSSILFELLRHKLGVAYYVISMNLAYSYEGAFVIYTGIDNKRVVETIGMILNELSKLKKNGVSNSDLEKIKKIRKTSFIMSMKGPDDYMNYYGIKETLFNIDPLAEYDRFDIKSQIEAYDNITVEMINHVIKNLFVPEKLNIFIYGHINNIKKIENALSFLQ